ncbi:uncharacterized protein LOC122937730 isoform X2 [Bufo gargarizans]|uniref:uncharacterized protein LOC122937730 isoform X2 n=1 Tax=Bufo gargarizans TaxID=30331 RepID=UPI001CF57665|nr:uncharacterized protein LOC122937730 isoform X2 [Bufo gargarizans]
MEAYAEADDHSDGELEKEQEFPGTSGPRPSTSGSVGASTSAPNSASSLVDPSGNPLFDPDALHHPRSAEWMPVAHVSDYLEHWVRRPLSKEARSKLRAECPRPLIPNKVCETPAVDQKMTQFLAKTGWNPRKGLDSAIKSCQDKLLDIFGPLAKIFEMAESAKVDGSPVDPEELTGWIQRAICIAGSTNSSLSIERRKAILFKIDPKLANLALTETGKEAQGQLFGDSFIKDLSRYVGAFTALDKAQSSMKRVFQGRVSTRAGSGRGRLSGRSSYQARSSGRGSFNQRPPFQDQRNPPSFFPARGGQWRSRSVRGNPSYRKSFGKSFPSGDFFHPSRRGQTPSMFPRLVQHHIRPMGADHCAGVPHRTYGFPRFRPFSPAPGATGQGASGHRTLFPLAQGCDRKGPSYPKGRSQPHFSSSEKRGSIPSGHKSPCTELCGALPPLQDGGDSPPSGLADSRGLDGEAGSQRCLSDGSGGLLLQGPSSLPVEGRSVALPVMAWLRSRGVRLVIYLDDILIMHQDQQSLLQHLQWTSDLLTSLGFLLNLEKSCLTPSRRMEFLGFTVDSVAESLSLPAEKLRTIRKELRHALSTPSLSLRHLARIIGLLASSIQAVFPAPLHYRALQRLKIAHLRAGASFADAVILDQEAQEELRWWLSNLEAWNGRAIFGFQPEFTVESDASLQGWGAHCEGISTGGRWSESETRFHINALELLAGSFAIRSFTKGIAHACIRLRMDNVSAVRYVNHLGGTQSATLARLAKDFWSYCMSRDIMVQAEYLPGLHNYRADWSSRCFTDGSDWRLNPEMFSMISDIWGPCSIDLFASRLNAHLPRFFSWRPDPEAEAVDAFLQDWSAALHYAFPPFAMIPRMLLQTRRQAAELVVVIPFWGSQVWYPIILELLVDVPLLLPTRTDLLQDPLGAPHPLLVDGSLQLLACRISGLQARSREFRRQLDASWTTLGLPAPENLTGQLGDLGLAGAWNGTWIPFRRL